MSHTQNPRLSEGGFKREFLADHEARALIQAFGGQIEQVARTIRDGKEATVYQCVARPSLGVPYLAAKVFRAHKFRAFGTEGSYLRGHRTGNRRKDRLMYSHSKRGRAALQETWTRREWDTLCVLYDAGADVPRPYDFTEDAILMEFVGEDDRPAQLLQFVDLAPGEIDPLFDRILLNIEIGLSRERVHGDLSAYNILYSAGEICVIDFPQAVDPRANRDAHEMLGRDVMNVCRYFRRKGRTPDHHAITHELWSRYLDNSCRSA